MRNFDGDVLNFRHFDNDSVQANDGAILAEVLSYMQSPDPITRLINTRQPLVAYFNHIATQPNSLINDIAVYSDLLTRTRDLFATAQTNEAGYLEQLQALNGTTYFPYLLTEPTKRLDILSCIAMNKINDFVARDGSLFDTDRGSFVITLANGATLAGLELEAIYAGKVESMPLRFSKHKNADKDFVYPKGALDMILTRTSNSGRIIILDEDSSTGDTVLLAHSNIKSLLQQQGIKTPVLPMSIQPSTHAHKLFGEIWQQELC